MIAFVGGLGLFLAAIKLLATLPQKIGAPCSRHLITRATGHFWRTCLTGSTAGVVLQSTSAVTLILAGLVGTRLIEPVSAMAFVAWANVGSSALVFLASIELRPLAMLLIGLGGLSLYYARVSNRSVCIALEAALYAGLMLLGLAIMRDAARALQSAQLVAEIAGTAHTAIPAALAVGFVSSLLIQSSSTATIVTLTAVQTGLVSIDDGVMIALGASSASGASILLLGADFKGSERQLILFHAAAKTVGVVAVLPTFLIGRWHPSLGIGRAIGHLVGDPGREVSTVFFLCQVVSLGAFYTARPHLAAVLAWLAPSTPHDDSISSSIGPITT